MKTRTKFLPKVLLIFCLAIMLAACEPRTKFVAPEIEPPADLIPSYIPEGFELINGYQIKPWDFEESRIIADAENCDENTWPICVVGPSSSFFAMQSPAGNDILGIYYQAGDNLLLITKSYYPGGSLDLWRAASEKDQEGAPDCECNRPCGRFAIAIDRLPVLFGYRKIQEIRTVGETQVAVLDGPMGLSTAFMRGEYLLTVTGGVSLEENLKIVASLLEN